MEKMFASVYKETLICKTTTTAYIILLIIMFIEFLLRHIGYNLCALNELSHLIFIWELNKVDNHYPHFVDAEIKTQRI